MPSLEDSRALLILAEILRYYFISTLVTILCYGFYLLLFVKSVLLIIPRLRSSIPSRWLLAFIIGLFIPTTVHLVSGVFTALTFLQFTSVGSVDNRIAIKLQMLAKLSQPAFEAFYYTGRINILLIDVIVIWRAYALQPHRRWLRILLVALLIFTLMFAAFVMIITPASLRYSIPVSVIARLNIARDVIALSVTLFGAACIGWTAWTFQKSVKEAKLRRHATSFVARTFLVLIEGCIILTLLQVAVIVLNFGMMNGNSGRYSFSSTTSSPVRILGMLLFETTIAASAIHPCLVTVLVSDESRNTRSAIGVSGVSTFAVTPPTLASYTV